LKDEVDSLKAEADSLLQVRIGTRV